MSKGKVLVLGGTGAMGVYVVPELLKLGFEVDAIAIDNLEAKMKEANYFEVNGKDKDVVGKILKNGYDAVIDYMTYSTQELKERYEMFLENTGHYIFLSSYRVYANADKIITENSPRVISEIKEEAYVKSDDYSISKCRQENIIENSSYLNWTMVRPSIVYSQKRFQLVTLEAPMFLPRVKEGKKVMLPKDAMGVQATMTWSGDIAKMMARLVLNKKAYREKYTLSTAEHNTWECVEKLYEDIIGLKAEWVDRDTYIKTRAGRDEEILPVKWQLDYDRLFDRAVDNSKILEVTGLKQSDFVSLKDGLEKELSALPKDFEWRGFDDVLKRMDNYFENK